MKEPEIVPLEQTLSNKIPIVPILGHPVYPGVFTPLMINSPDDLKAETIPPVNYEKILKKRKKGKNESLRDTYKHKKRAARN